MKTSSAYLSLLALVPYVAGHGYLSQVAIDGQVYQGNVPNNYKAPSPIRLIDDVSPVKGATNVFMSCGQNAANAEVVAPANPGSSVAFSWASGDSTNWPHNTGPLMTYMAACTGTTCDQFNASQAQWFKIDEAGKESDGSTWVQANIQQGQSYTVTLPQNMMPGDYLIRHEIIALHVATTVGGAEFYPSCTQVRIGGNGTGTPDSTVSFPGAYSDTDPGIFDPTVFNPGSNYTFPGPPLSNLVSGDNSTAPASSQGPDSASSSPAASTAVPPPPATSSVAAPSSTGSCKSGSKKRMFKRHVMHASH
ncbi:hypothetical protein EW026_g6601 [Hermanssonia centrifuga]|uniref:lytic cellulose monooxygenase (C4-dehydrogenating) n=1 Tax=Hermanssonia centrifuga TaxID=98765 RepID=A0A4S4KEV4_9APHY|nr:hypothetical protein EW026_g6601 [Hermanssonia centrifuga]